MEVYDMASIKDKMHSAMWYFKGHNVLRVEFSVLHSDTTDEVHGIVDVLFSVVAKKFDNMFANLLNRLAQKDYEKACETFDNYCDTQKVHTTLIIKVLEDGAKEEDIYSVGDDLDVVFLG